MQDQAETNGPLVARISETPRADASARVDGEIEAWRQQAATEPALSDLSRLLGQDRVRDLLAGIISGSPYLQGLMARDLARLQQVEGAAAQRPFNILRKATVVRLHPVAECGELRRLCIAE